MSDPFSSVYEKIDVCIRDRDMECSVSLMRDFPQVSMTYLYRYNPSVVPYFDIFSKVYPDASLDFYLSSFFDYLRDNSLEGVEHSVNVFRRIFKEPHPIEKMVNVTRFLRLLFRFYLPPIEIVVVYIYARHNNIEELYDVILDLVDVPKIGDVFMNSFEFVLDRMEENIENVELRMANLLSQSQYYVLDTEKDVLSFQHLSTEYDQLYTRLQSLQNLQQNYLDLYNLVTEEDSDYDSDLE